MVLRVLLPVLLLLTASAAPLAAAEPPGTWADAARAAVRAWAEAHGVPAQELLDAVVELDGPGPDGAPPVRLTVAAFLDRVGGSPAVDGTGVAGTPELTVGNTVHAYVNIRFFASALAYKVHDSAVTPATPPVVLPPPATAAFFDPGGPVRNVEGSYLLGGHTVGTVVGSNVDTAGPYLPLVSAGIVTDAKIDFVGHAAVFQGEACIIFGLLCIAVGLLLGDGVAAWDTTEVDLPAVP